MSKVIVVGGGVAGSSAAWHLASRGHRVTLLEQFEQGHDRGGSHGSSRIFRLAYPDAFYVSLTTRALPLWRQLEHETGQEVLTLTGAIDHGPPEALAALAATLAAAGHPHEHLSPDQVYEWWPGLRIDTAALFHPHAGRLHADRAVAALQVAAAQHGADVRHGVAVEYVTASGSDRVEVRTGDESLRADALVLAVGGWAPAALRELTIPAPRIRVTQEQPAHFPAENPFAWPSFIHHGGAGLPADSGVYGLGSVDGVKVGLHAVGPEVTDPSGRDRRIDDAVQQRLQDYAAKWLPGVDVSRPTSSTCLYEVTPDHDFIIDRHGPVTVLAGFSGHGFKFGSVLGELAADLVEGRPGLPRFGLRRGA